MITAAMLMRRLFCDVRKRNFSDCDVTGSEIMIIRDVKPIIKPRVFFQANKYSRIIRSGLLPYSAGGLRQYGLGSVRLLR